MAQDGQSPDFTTMSRPVGPPQPLSPSGGGGSNPQVFQAGEPRTILRQHDPLIVESGDPATVSFGPQAPPSERIFFETPVPTPPPTQVPIPHSPLGMAPAGTGSVKAGNFVPVSEAPDYIDTTLPAYTVMAASSLPRGALGDDLPRDPRLRFEGWTRARDGEPVAHEIKAGNPEAFYYDDELSQGGGQRLLGTKAGAVAEGQIGGFKQDLANRFPLMFTLFCSVVFTIPIWLVYNIGQDPQVKYWITEILWIVVFLPCLYLYTHCWHVLRGSPSRILVILCTVGSCFLILCLADVVLIQAYQMGNRFAAKDCTTFDGKRDLELEWQAAKTFYANCMANTAAYAKVPLEEAAVTYRIQDCTGYDEQLPLYPSWPYLESLEKQNHCSGWCTRGQPLWSFSPVKDSCSATVADIMYNKIQWTMLQVVVYTIICLGFVSITLITTGSLLRQSGVSW